MMSRHTHPFALRYRRANGGNFEIVSKSSFRCTDQKRIELKQAWVYLKEWSKELVTTAIENGADAIVCLPGLHDRVKALGRITTVSLDGDLRPGVDVFFEPLDTREDEERISRRLASGTVVLMAFPTGYRNGPEDASTPIDLESEQSATAQGPKIRPWEVIPLENLIARGGELIVPVRSPDDLELALTVLEKGVAGVLIDTDNPERLKTLLKQTKAVSESVTLAVATVEHIEATGLGDRVCVDTCTLMQEGEGMLVGNSSGFLFLVQAESISNPYVAPRAFRVNAGPVHSYLKTPEGATRYLSELGAGDRVLIARSDGSTQGATVGRVKIERRPLLLIKAACGNRTGSIILQNAETIRLTNPDGKAVSVVEIQPGDSVLVALEDAGRHFGIKIEETIREK
jgi:3-dehydroquinate synthase II